jgi:hypothetical protein
MKRSEINRSIKKAKYFFKKINFLLPPWAFWKPEQWKGKYNECSEIMDNKLGWDLTDFGLEKFMEKGLLLFTSRDGNPKINDKTYAEKIMLAEEDQVTPMHYHKNKMEDIINRGGADLVIQLYNSTGDELPVHLLISDYKNYL